VLHQVSAQAGKKIPAATALQITNSVNAIRATLGC
jgi:hypothetical protein